MAHFAEIGLNNEVLRVIVVNNAVLLDSNGIEQEGLGADFCRSLYGGVWLQTSYNGSIRKNFAAAGYTYYSNIDAFVPPKTFPSWILNNNTALWEAPVPYPKDGADYMWDEDTISWVLQPS